MKYRRYSLSGTQNIIIVSESEKLKFYIINQQISKNVQINKKFHVRVIYTFKWNYI